MMAAIWKYELPIEDEVKLLMPEGATVLSAANQSETLCIWALVDPLAQRETRHFRIVGTGHKVDTYRLNYIDTVLMAGGRLVWHVFEKAVDHYAE